MRQTIQHRDATDDADSRSSFPEIVRDFEELGFRPVGRIQGVVVPGGYESLANGYTPAERDLFLEHASLPADVLCAPDGSAFVEVAWFWGWPSVRVRTVTTTGCLVETLRRWDAMPPWPVSMARAHRHADVDPEMRRSATGSADRSIRVVTGGPAELWTAHQEHLATQALGHGGTPARHETVGQALWLTARAHEHDLACLTRANRVLLALVTLVAVALGVVSAPLFDSLLVYLLVGPVSIMALLSLLGPWAQTRLWYVRWIRPSFRSAAARSATPVSA